MKSMLVILPLAVILNCRAAEPRDEFAIGLGHYSRAEFKKANVHFKLAIKANLSDAESYYWMGMSYQALADIAVPFGGAYNSRARFYLSRALELAPERQDFRLSLFDLLLDSTPASRDSLRQAAELLRAVPESHPDYLSMRRELDRANGIGISFGSVSGDLFLAAPRAAFRLARLRVCTPPEGVQADLPGAGLR